MSEATKDSPQTTDQPGEASGLPLPSPEPATNLYIADIVLRGATSALRDTLRNRMITAKYDPDQARELIDGRTILTSLSLYGASKLATRSPIGLALVAAGLVAKTLYDRGKAVQRRKREVDAEE